MKYDNAMFWRKMSLFIGNSKSKYVKELVRFPNLKKNILYTYHEEEEEE